MSPQCPLEVIYEIAKHCDIKHVFDKNVYFSIAKDRITKVINKKNIVEKTILNRHNIIKTFDNHNINCDVAVQ